VAEVAYATGRGRWEGGGGGAVVVEECCQWGVLEDSLGLNGAESIRTRMMLPHKKRYPNGEVLVGWRALLDPFN